MGQVPFRELNTPNSRIPEAEPPRHPCDRGKYRGEEVSMKAFRYNAGAAGDDTVYFEEVDRPKPKSGGHDILVAVQGVAVNPVDTKVRRGLVPVPADVDVLGWDAAGIVEAIG